MAGTSRRKAGCARATDIDGRPPRALLARIMWNARIDGPSGSEFGELTLAASADSDKMEEARARLIALLETPFGFEAMQELLGYGEPTNAHRTAGRKRRTLAHIKPRERFVRTRVQEFGELTLQARMPAEKVQEARERLASIIGSTYGYRALQSIIVDDVLRPRLLRAFSGPKPARGGLAEAHIRIAVWTADPADVKLPKIPPSVEMIEHDALAEIARDEKLDLSPLVPTAPARGRRFVPTHPVAGKLAIAVVEGRRPPGTTGTPPPPDDRARIAEWVRHVRADAPSLRIAPQTLAKQIAAEVDAIEVLNPRRPVPAKRPPPK